MHGRDCGHPLVRMHPPMSDVRKSAPALRQPSRRYFPTRPDLGKFSIASREPDRFRDVFGNLFFALKGNGGATPEKRVRCRTELSIAVGHSGQAMSGGGQGSAGVAAVGGDTGVDKLAGCLLEPRRTFECLESHCLGSAMLFVRHGYFDKALAKIAGILAPPFPLPAFAELKLLSIDDIRRYLNALQHGL